MPAVDEAAHLSEEMDADLIQSMRAFAAGRHDLRECTSEEAEHMRAAVAKRFDIVFDSPWSWESLLGTARVVSYGRADGLARLVELLPNSGADSILFVTDEEPPPWPCFVAPASALTDLLREQRMCEFCLVDAGMSWIVFDNHHNALIALGSGLRM